MGQVEAFLELLDYRQQRRTFILVSLVKFISDGIAARSDKQPQHHLRVLVLAVLLRKKLNCRQKYDKQK